MPFYETAASNTSIEQDVKMPSHVEKRIADLVAQNDIVVFSKTFCPYCKRAKAILDSNNLSYTAVEVNLDAEDIPMHEWQDALQRMTNQRSVPNIFIAGKHLGGSDDLARLGERGDLAKL